MTKTILLQNELIQLIHGAVGQLELAVSRPENDGTPPIAIVCHPHPLYGGTMSNKVVTTLVKTYQSLGFMTIRFNFRGIGQSSGHYDDGKGELDDLLSVLHFATQQTPLSAVYLAGFSFGAYIATKAASQEKIAHLVAVAPPVHHFSMQALNPTCRWIIVQGDQDEIVPADEVYAFAASRANPPQILRFDTATHFFHGHLKELQERLQEMIHVP